MLLVCASKRPLKYIPEWLSITDLGDTCQSPAFGGEGDWGSTDFEVKAPAGQRIEAIHICGSGKYRFNGLAAGWLFTYSECL